MSKVSPFLPVLLSTSVGIYLQHCLNFGYPLLIFSIVISFVVTIFFWLFFEKKIFIAIFLCGTFCCLGALLHFLHLKKFSYYRRIIENRCLTIVGKVIDKDYACYQKTQELITLQILFCYDREGNSFPVSGNNVLLHLYHKTDLNIGDVIQGYGIFIRHQGTVENNNFLNHLCKNGLLAYVFKRKNFYYKHVYRPTFSWARYLWHKKQDLYNRIMKRLSRLTQTYYSLIFLGNKKQVQHSFQLRKIFGEYGLMHCLARSGLHIVLFILFLQMFLRLVPIPLLIKRFFLLFVVIIYNILTWSSVSFSRAYNVFLLMQGGYVLGQTVSFPHILTLICLVFLLFNPMYLFAFDFQLSFGLTFILSYSSFQGVKN
jgi:ComEC/Rec2-related protein